MMSPQLSVSMARTYAPIAQAASANHGVHGPSSGQRTPATKNAAPPPSSVNASAAAFLAERNVSSGVGDSTTRT